MAEMSLQEMIQALPPDLQKEVRDFAAFLMSRQVKKRHTSRKDTGTLKMRFEWQGALKDMGAQYTSVQLQHQISDVRAGHDEISS